MYDVEICVGSLKLEPKPLWMLNISAAHSMELLVGLVYSYTLASDMLEGIRTNTKDTPISERAQVFIMRVQGFAVCAHLFVFLYYFSEKLKKNTIQPLREKSTDNV